MSSLSHLFAFLHVLKERRIRFVLSQSRDDAIMVSFATFGARYEVEFLEDRPVYSIFRGRESVEDDYPALLQMIDEATR